MAEAARLQPILDTATSHPAEAAAQGHRAEDDTIVATASLPPELRVAERITTRSPKGPGDPKEGNGGKIHHGTPKPMQLEAAALGSIGVAATVVRSKY